MMHYIVDGHNLIGQCSTIQLTDPDDEAKLTAALHRWVLRHGRARVTVVFDGGVYGQPDSLDRPQVRVIFAHSPKDADTRIIALIQAIQVPGAYRVVSSDRVVAAAARQQRVQVISAAQFAVELEQPPTARRTPNRRQRPEPKLPRTEVDAWLRAFGEQSSADD